MHVTHEPAALFMAALSFGAAFFVHFSGASRDLSRGGAVLRSLPFVLLGLAALDLRVDLEGPGERVVVVDRSASFSVRLPAAEARVGLLDARALVDAGPAVEATSFDMAGAIGRGLNRLGGRRGDLASFWRVRNL